MVWRGIIEDTRMGFWVEIRWHVPWFELFGRCGKAVRRRCIFGGAYADLPRAAVGAFGEMGVQDASAGQRAGLF